MADGQVFHLFPQGQHGSGPVQRPLLPGPVRLSRRVVRVQQSAPIQRSSSGQVARHHGAGHLQFLPGAAQAACSTTQTKTRNAVSLSILCPYMLDLCNSDAPIMRYLYRW
jgi:hypothetical protein